MHLYVGSHVSGSNYQSLRSAIIYELCYYPSVEIRPSVRIIVLY